MMLFHGGPLDGQKAETAAGAIPPRWTLIEHGVRYEWERDDRANLMDLVAVSLEGENIASPAAPRKGKRVKR